jgi:hypothetical protein
LVVLIPLAVAHYFERGRRFDARLIPFVGVPILVCILIRATPLVYGYVPPSALFQDFEYLNGQFHHRLRLDGGVGNAMLFTISASFAATWVLAALGLRGAPRFQRLTTLMVPLVLVLPVFGSDWDRLFTVAFPVVIPLAARIRLRWLILGLFLAVQAILAALTIERVSTIYTDYNNSLPTGHFENRNPALTSALLGIGVILVLFGAARSTSLRATVTRPTRA